MTRLIGSIECQALVDLGLSEAESDTDTWSLATYVKVRDVVPHFANSSMALVAKRMVDLALSHILKCSTCYKLAQIVSAIHSPLSVFLPAVMKNQMIGKKVLII
jgi:hypothetical protein